MDELPLDDADDFDHLRRVLQRQVVKCDPRIDIFEMDTDETLVRALAARVRARH